MRILIIDDHELVREGIGVIIRSIDPQAEIGFAESCQSGIDKANQGNWNLFLLDLNLPDQPGFVALERFRRDHPEVPVVVISGQEDRATVLRALDHGAKAFLPKSAQSSRIRTAIEALLAGRVFLPESVLGETFSPPRSGQTQALGKQVGLTERQREVLSLVVAGLPNKLIARRLDIAESTVKLHVSAIFRELRVSSRTQAIVEVARSGMVLA